MQASGLPVLGSALTLRGLPHSVTIALAAGAANVCTVTVTVVDYDGAVVVGLHSLELLTSSAASGAGISVVAYSGSLVAVTGKLTTTLTAKHHFLIQTDPTTGTFVGSLTDTAKTQGETIVVRKPLGSGCVVSAATVTANFG